MKTKLIVAMTVAVILMASGASYAAIEDSKHDLSTGSSGPSSTLIGGTTEICIFCHAPHDPDPGGQPLWNHAAAVTTSWTMYPETLNETTPGATPGAGSLRCLSCHDGAGAVDAYGGVTGTASKKITDTQYLLGSNLSNDHPIAIDYGGTAKGLVAAPVDATLSPTNTVECSSCHDPHDTTEGSFLRETMTASALCQDCHGK
jgi:predicted CXXCH cytochrome family protein